MAAGLWDEASVSSRLAPHFKQIVSITHSLGAWKGKCFQRPKPVAATFPCIGAETLRAF